MTPEDIPQELIDILNTAAGRPHHRDGSVITTLAAILTRYDELKTQPAAVTVRTAAYHLPLARGHCNHKRIVRFNGAVSGPHGDGAIWHIDGTVCHGWVLTHAEAEAQGLHTLKDTP